MISLVHAPIITYFFSLRVSALGSIIISGLLADYFQNKNKLLIFIMFILFGPILLLIGLNKSIEMLYILIPLAGIAAFVWSPIINLVVGEVVPPHLVGTATGFANAMWQIGSLLSPMVVGAVLDATNSYMYAFATLAVGPVFGAFVILLVKDKR